MDDDETPVLPSAPGTPRAEEAEDPGTPHPDAEMSEQLEREVEQVPQGAAAQGASPARGTPLQNAYMAHANAGLSHPT